jgi:hypothetical protein
MKELSDAKLAQHVASSRELSNSEAQRVLEKQAKVRDDSKAAMAIIQTAFQKQMSEANATNSQVTPLMYYHKIYCRHPRIYSRRIVTKSGQFG